MKLISSLVILPQSKDWMRFHDVRSGFRILAWDSQPNFLKIRVNGEVFHSFFLHIPMDSDDMHVLKLNFSEN